MARIRLLKPEFFTNLSLASCSAHARLLYAGLWCLADREGRLEDIPKKIEGEIFPHERVKIAKLLQELEKGNFIVRYKSGSGKDLRRYIAIPSFAKHQHPHPNEKPSKIPAPLSISCKRNEQGPTTTRLTPSVINSNSNAAAAEVLAAAAAAAQLKESQAASIQELAKRGLSHKQAEREAAALPPACIQAALKRFDAVQATDPRTNCGGFMATVLADHHGCDGNHPAAAVPVEATTDEERAARTLRLRGVEVNHVS